LVLLKEDEKHENCKIPSSDWDKTATDSNHHSAMTVLEAHILHFKLVNLV